MSKFNFNLAGQLFEVIAPPGTTEAAARAVFDQQANTGGLTNLTTGQSVSALSQLRNGLVSAASQVKGALTNLVSGAGATLSRLTGANVAKPMQVSDFVNVTTQTTGIGPLNGKQVQGLLAQSAASASQASAAFSVDKGIGTYGISPALLENSGYLKPGTVQQFGKPSTVTQADINEAARINSQGGSITPDQVAKSRALQDALKSPTVWTGKQGINSLTGMLGDPSKQLNVQTDIMQSQFTQLSKTGVIPNGLPSADVGALVQAAGKVGAGLTAAWAKGGAPGDIVNSISNLAKSGQLAVNFTDTKVPNSLSGQQAAPRATNTVNRTVLNQAYTQFIGSGKVPPVNYG
jgi:hypothetical protein